MAEPTSWSLDGVAYAVAGSDCPYAASRPGLVFLVALKWQRCGTFLAWQLSQGQSRLHCARGQRDDHDQGKPELDEINSGADRRERDGELKEARAHIMNQVANKGAASFTFCFRRWHSRQAAELRLVLGLTPFSPFSLFSPPFSRAGDSIGPAARLRRKDRTESVRTCCFRSGGEAQAGERERGEGTR